MGRINWGDPTERYYESGVDRGVLFTDGNPGVPWNGLISVNETSAGGEPRTAYIDGVAFRSINTATEFEASLEAFAAPREFDACDGLLALANGLIATEQPRKSFHLCYRSLVGSAVDADAGYKIHIIYNARAQPSGRNRATLSGSSDTSSMQWNITAVPPLQAGLRPTAHFMIDSRYTPAGLLKNIEDVLYGSDAGESRVPPVAELIRIFAEYFDGDVVNGGTAASLHDSTVDGGIATSLYTNVLEGGAA